MSSELLFLTLLANWINTFSENEKGWVGGGGVRLVFTLLGKI